MMRALVPAVPAAAAPADGASAPAPRPGAGTGETAPRPRVRTQTMTTYQDVEAQARDGAGLDEATLVARAREGDAEAFAVLVRRHSRPLYGLALRVLGNAEDAEDAVQESFVAAWRRLPEYRGQAAFSSWMYRIVTNRCLNLARARHRDVPLERAPEMPTREPSPEQRAESGAAVSALRRALTGLTVEQRACWVLRELHGMDYAEIARATGSTPDAVRGRIFRARRELAELMGAWR